MAEHPPRIGIRAAFAQFAASVGALLREVALTVLPTREEAGAVEEPASSPTIPPPGGPPQEWLDLVQAADPNWWASTGQDLLDSQAESGDGGGWPDGWPGDADWFEAEAPAPGAPEVGVPEPVDSEPPIGDGIDPTADIESDRDQVAPLRRVVAAEQRPTRPRRLRDLLRQVRGRDVPPPEVTAPRQVASADPVDRRAQPPDLPEPSVVETGSGPQTGLDGPGPAIASTTGPRSGHAAARLAPPPGDTADQRPTPPAAPPPASASAVRPASRSRLTRSQRSVTSEAGSVPAGSPGAGSDAGRGGTRAARRARLILPRATPPAVAGDGVGEGPQRVPFVGRRSRLRPVPGPGTEEEPTAPPIAAVPVAAPGGPVGPVGAVALPADPARPPGLPPFWSVAPDGTPVPGLWLGGLTPTDKMNDAAQRTADTARRLEVASARPAAAAAQPRPAAAHRLARPAPQVQQPARRPRATPEPSRTPLPAHWPDLLPDDEAAASEATVEHSAALVSGTVPRLWRNLEAGAPDPTVAEQRRR